MAKERKFKVTPDGSVVCNQPCLDSGVDCVRFGKVAYCVDESCPLPKGQNTGDWTDTSTLRRCALVDK